VIDYTKFRQSLKRLEEQYENSRNLDPSMPEITREAIDESIIQRFETCFDALWKVLRLYLEEELGVPDTPASPKPVFRIAHENNLLRGPAEYWLEYTDRRNDTSHDYSIEKAEACLATAPDFIEDAIGLYQTMTGTTWE